MKTNQLKAGVILSYLSLFIGNAISIVYTPIMLRLLGQSEYGLYSLTNTVVGYLGLLSFGFSSAYICYYSRYKVKNDSLGISKLNGMFMTIFIIIGIVSLFVGGILIAGTPYLFSQGLSSAEMAKAKILMIILVINIAISFPLSVFDSYIIANEAYIFQKVMLLIKSIINPFIMLPILLLGFKSIGMVIGGTVINIFAGTINLIYCFKKLNMKFSFFSFDFSLFKEIAVFSSYIFINIVVDQINWNVDKFLLGMFQSTVAVAIYGLAAQLNTYYISFSTSISAVFVPRINQLVAQYNDDNQLTDLFTRVGRIQFMILSLVATGLIFLGKDFIAMWAGDNYQSSYIIALILILPVTIPSIQNIGIEIQRAKNLHKFRSILYLAIAICNLLISIPLCQKYGGIGCAIGTAIAMVIGNGFIMNIYYHKCIHLDIKYFWGQIIKLFPALILPVILGIILMRNVPMRHVFSFIICGLIYTAVFCISLWLLGMNSYEKALIKKPLHRLFSKLTSQS